MSDSSEVVQQLQALQAQVKELQSQMSRSAARDDSVPMASDEVEEEVEEVVTWDDVLGKHRRAVTTEDAVKFTKLLENPPTLQALKESKGNVLLYQGVPEAPQARRNRVDQQLHSAQAKIELGFHLLTHYLESGNRAAIGAAAAWQRSAWEDLKQQRRSFLAGREAWKLTRRADDTANRLLTEEEEKKIGKGKAAGKGKSYDRSRSTIMGWGAQQASSSQDWQPQRSSSRGRGKGKGGRGRGREQK